MNYVRLPLENTYNTRELGGYPTVDGVTAWHTFLRSDDLTNLSSHDLQFLSNYGVGVVIDLRSEQELHIAPHPKDSPFRYYNIPLAGDHAVNLQFAEVSYAKFYAHMLREKQAEFREIFAILAEEDDAVLFHCAAGKDRTGVLAALLLGSVGVAAADIIANYQTTRTHLLANPLYEHYLEPLVELIRSDAQTMKATLNFLDEEFGGIPAYLLAIGVSASQLEQLRQKFSIALTYA